MNNDQFQHNVLDELCSQVVKSRSKNCQELRQFVQNGCSQLKMQVCVDKLDISDVLMQCEVYRYDEKTPCIIFVNQSVSEEMFPSQVSLNRHSSGIDTFSKSNHMVKNINGTLLLA